MTVDATGAAVAPGFIDIHSHGDVTLLRDPRVMSSISQGVTTIVVGNCGHSPAPLADPQALPSLVFGYGPGLETGWRSFGEYLEAAARARPSVNVAALVGHHALRAEALPRLDRPADAGGKRRLLGALSRALEEGAFGLSVGLEYPMGQHASTAEVATLAEALARPLRLFAIHTRNRDTQSVEAFAEAFELARQTGSRTQISHLVPRFGAPDGAATRAIAEIARLRRDGVDIALDQHTRLHGLTKLTTMLPPDLAQLDGVSLAARLADPVIQRRIRRFRRPLLKLGVLGRWDRLSFLVAPNAPELEGRALATMAAASGTEPIDLVIEALRRAGADAQQALVLGLVHTEDELAEAFADPWCSPGSDATTLATDGPLAGEVFLGAYTWATSYLRRFVRDRPVISLAEAVRRMTSLPAARLGLRDRGLIAPGACADVVVFDPANVAERGTLEQPNEYATGIRSVLVNGSLAWAHGEPSPDRHGRVLVPST